MERYGNNYMERYGHIWKDMETGWWFGLFLFSIQLGIIIPTDELIFFRGVGIPPTRKYTGNISEYMEIYVFFRCLASGNRL